ncbi:MAG: alpha/beta fold hydrolase [Candidatus Odinarchaeota archaeon]
MSRYETIELTDEVRKTLPGEFVQLTDGYVHYELAGPVEGNVVVLVHGFSTPSFIWDPTFNYLVNDFRVLRYDLYGRGHSDRPEKRYNMEFFTKQLFELVNKLGLTSKKFNLVGLSMGGGICVVFADQYPDLVKKMSLIDPIGFPMKGNALFSLMKIPILNRLAINLIGYDRLLEGQKGDFFNYDRIDEYLEKYAEQMKYRGFLRAIRSTMLNISFTGLVKTYERLGNRGIPMQLFWGKKDQTIPFSTSQKVIAAVPSIEFHPVKESGHVPHYTHPDEVNPLLQAFLLG